MNVPTTLQKPLTILHGLIAGIVLGIGIIFVPPFVISGRVEQYQYDNVRVQRDIVDKRVLPVEHTVRDLEDRVSDSEIKVNAQLTDSRRTQRKLEDLMYKASPDVLERMSTELRGGSVHQIASPTINVSPIVNAR